MGRGDSAKQQQVATANQHRSATAMQHHSTAASKNCSFTIPFVAMAALQSSKQEGILHLPQD